MTDHRTFHTRSLELDDGLELDEEAGEAWGMIVPFNREARIVEPNEDGVLTHYREQFLSGSLTAQTQHETKRGDRAWKWLPLYYSHTESLTNHIGAATEVHQRDDGVYARFELLPDTNLDKVKRLLSRSAGYFSVKFRDVAPPSMADDLISRTQVMLQHVAAVGIPAYADAKVTGVRDTEELTVETPRLDEIRALLPALDGDTSLIESDPATPRRDEIAAWLASQP